MPANDVAVVPPAHADDAVVATAMVVVQTLLADALTRATPAELLDLAQVLALTSQSRSSLYRAMSSGDFPRPCETPSGRRWKRKAVLAWVEKLK